MRALILGPDEKAAIAALMERAAANVISLDTVKRLADRGQGDPNMAGLNAEFTIKIPTGFHVTFTHEQQRQCVCRHLSVSVDAGGMGPHPIAVSMIMREFGFVSDLAHAIKWTEPIGRGDLAVNVLEPLDGDVEKLRA